MLGNGRLEALCFDGEKRLAHIRGKLRKKVWINQGDIILLSLRDYQDEKGDVILKYSADEARSLKAYGELPESAKINETDTYVLSSRRAEGKARLTNSLGFIDTAMKAWTTMLSSTRTGTEAATKRTLTLMRSKGSQPLAVPRLIQRSIEEVSIRHRLDCRRWLRCERSTTLSSLGNGVGLI